MDKRIIFIILGVFFIVSALAASVIFFSVPEDGFGNLIGGQKDEYGCLIGTGYSWCPSTQKCQRMWEEYCAEYKDQYRGATEIKDFVSCVNAGNPVMESYPRRCSANGQTYTEDLDGNVNINMFYPIPNDMVASPLKISGEARGNWYFEASFPIRLEDEQGNFLAETIAQAQGDWMNEDFVPFNAELKFNPKNNAKGYLILIRDNPSGLSENDESIKIPVLFKAQEQIIVKNFFGKYGPDSNMDDCEKVYPVERSVVKTDAIARAALEQLLIGPELNEINEYFTSINTGVKINSLVIEDGVARVDFDKQIEYQLGGSCRVATIRAQITETLKQFPTVKSVIISVEGKVAEALQP